MKKQKNELILEELKSIRRLLTILTQDKLNDFNQNIKKKYLTTEQRISMYELFDGEHSLKEIGEKVKVTPRGVSKFAVLLVNANLLEYVEIDGKQKNPKRLF